MREIKLQAWVKPFKRMVQIKGFTSYHEDNITIFDNVGSYTYMSADVVLRQFTGLLDKNGKEIYEGDIVVTTYDGETFVGIVVYDVSELGFKATNGKENYGSNFQYLTCCEEVEVIGNIYENPELLEG